MAKRFVYCEDAIAWLNSQEKLAGRSFVASLPDISEFTLSLEDWKNWFTKTAALILSRCPDDGVTIFYQSDIKNKGTWVDKGYLCQKAAEELGHSMLWHKIVCRSPAGLTTFGRPAYSHLLCFSKTLLLHDVSKSTADVMADLGEKTWERGMGLEACLIIAKFVAEQTKCQTIVNPFCGEGSMLAAANHLGLEAIGIERSPKRAEKSRCQQIAKDGKSWELVQP
ncbi:MAG: SAM-dependent methyltransferase [Pseudomonadota bacterium]